MWYIRLFLVALIIFTANTSVKATNYYVNDNTISGDVFCTVIGATGNNGLSPSTPKLSLKALLTTYSTAITSGDIIYIDAGYYNTETSITHTISGVSFIGAGNNLTFIDNAYAGTSTNFFMYIYASNIVMRNFTVKGYENNGSQTPGHSGQAITIGGGASAISNILLDNIVFSSNGESGGNPSLSVLAKSTVTVNAGGSFCNTAGTAYTGGIEAYGTAINLTILNYAIGNNYKDGGFDGGGLRIDGDATTIVTVKNTKISNNVATYGGGISQINGDLKVYDCVIDNNSAGQTSSTIYGGGYRIIAGTARFARCKITNNNQSAGTLKGGGVGARYTTVGPFSTSKTIALTFDSCYFSGNTPNGNGADVYGASGSGNACNITMRDCIFATTGISYNVVSDASSPATSINITYFGTAPSSNGSNITKTLSSNTSYTPNPSVPTFTGTCATSMTILPIELISFEGQCFEGKIQLLWKTATEKNNETFIIEKSMNGTDFYTIGTVKGAGTTSTFNTYQFIDDAQTEDIQYYRLTQVDYNGKKSVSDIITVTKQCDTKDDTFKLYPNPSNDEVFIELKLFKKELINLSIYDHTGRLIKEEINQTYQSGYNSGHFNVTGLAQGIYYIKAILGDKVYTEKLIKL